MDTLQPPSGERRLGVALFALACIAFAAKVPDVLIAPQFWAEDGAIFFAQQLGRDRPLLFQPYSGYLNVMPRLIAWLASPCDVAIAPLVYSVAGIAVASACVAYVTLACRGAYPRAIVFAAFFVIPTAGDIFGNTTNVQWFLQFVIVAALLVSRGTGQRLGPFQVAGYVALALACLSGPFSTIAVGAVLALGLAAWSSRHVPLAEPARALWAMVPKGRLAVVLVCAAVQVCVMASGDVRTPEAEFSLSRPQLAELGLARIRPSYQSIVHTPWAPLHLVMLGAYAAAIAVAVRAAFTAWNAATLRTLLLLSIGASQPVLAFLKQKAVHTLAAPSHYFYLLAVVGCWSLSHALWQLRPAQRNPVLVIVGLVLGLVLSLVPAAYRLPAYFVRPALTDLDWPRHAQAIKAGVRGTVIPLNPLPWHMVLRGER